jgi:hypothetical protein
MQRNTHRFRRPQRGANSGAVGIGGGAQPGRDLPRGAQQIGPLAADFERLDEQANPQRRGYRGSRYSGGRRLAPGNIIGN